MLDYVKQSPLAFMMLVVLFVPGIATAIAGLLARRRGSATIASVIALLIGGGGVAWTALMYLNVVQKVESVLTIDGLEAEDVRRLSEAGMEEARTLLTFGLGMMSPVLIVALIGLLRAGKKPR